MSACTVTIEMEKKSRLIANLVLIKENNLPVCKWKIDGVLEQHTGSGQAMLLGLLQHSAIITQYANRVVAKLLILPIEINC